MVILDNTIHNGPTMRKRLQKYYTNDNPNVKLPDILVHLIICSLCHLNLSSLLNKKRKENKNKYICIKLKLNIRSY